MHTSIFQLDAFTTRRFAGNPAAVMPMDRFLDDAVLQAIAAENNLSETAFLVAEGGDYRLRWFTPAKEVPLCGHATLDSAAVVMERLEPGRSAVVFHTASGALHVSRSESGYLMNFPARPSEPVPSPPGLAEALGAVPAEVHVNSFNYMALVESASVLRELAPDMAALRRVDRSGVIATAPGDGNYDFISRSSERHSGRSGYRRCALHACAVLGETVGKTTFRAFQASKRGGEITCRLAGDRVELEGSCVFYLEGSVEI